MEVLQSLVQGVQLQGEVANKRADGDKDVEVPKLIDIVAYLTTFERLMIAYEVRQASLWERHSKRMRVQVPRMIGSRKLYCRGMI